MIVSLITCYKPNRESISFNREVRPIFNAKCLSCHGGVKEMGGFSLLIEEDAFQNTESGKQAIVRGNHQASELYKRLIHKDVEMRMPFEGAPLSQKEINTITQWIDEGAKWEKHWAYIPPDKNLTLPQVKNKAWPQNGIDHFVLNKLEVNDIAPNVKAEKSTLIRRVYLDLIGLPPTLEAAKNYLEDDSEQGFEKVVDSLLAAPHFGEHWAAMWLDLARYGDSQGYQKDIVRRHIWRYRDWVIHAFNQDLSFDQFTIQQLAGDLLPNPSENQLLATAFHRNTNTNTEGGTDDEEFRTYAVMDRLATTFEIWQGMTMSCVQCHSHPYDPILHKEYYQGLAFFNNTADTDRGDEFPRKKILSPGEKLKLAALKKEIATARDNKDTLSPTYVKQITAMEAIQPVGVPVMVELHSDSSRITQIFEKGNWLVKGETVHPDVPHILPPLKDNYPPNRLGLSQWLVDGDNPLTARVIVNRFWERIYGQGLVVTTEDFGTQGDKPLHQDLLDWLALRFEKTHKWSVKQLLKDIVMSATYQQSSVVSPTKLKKDFDNRLFTRGGRFRLSAEQVRDQALVVSGLINRKVYGPSVMPFMPDGVYSVIRHAHRWQTSEDGEAYRRGIYTFWRKTSPYPSMVTFDVPSREFCVSRRVRTNTPLQAMITLNDPVYMEAAKGLAHLLLNSHPFEDGVATHTMKQQIKEGYYRLFYRHPKESELATLFEFYQKTLTAYRKDNKAVKELIPNEQSASSEFAALVNLSNVLLNLDEFLMKG